MKTQLLAVLPVVLLIAADDPKGDAAKAEMIRLEGTWKETSVTFNGKTLPNSEIAETTLVIKSDGTWVMKDGKESWHGTFTVDPGATPKRGDFKILSGKLKEMTTLDIYELEGDVIKFCYVTVPTGKETTKMRPSKFSSEPGSGHILSVMKRTPVK